MIITPENFLGRLFDANDVEIKHAFYADTKTGLVKRYKDLYAEPPDYTIIEETFETPFTFQPLLSDVGKSHLDQFLEGKT